MHEYWSYKKKKLQNNELRGLTEGPLKYIGFVRELTASMFSESTVIFRYLVRPFSQLEKTSGSATVKHHEPSAYE